MVIRTEVTLCGLWGCRIHCEALGEVVEYKVFIVTPMLLVIDSASLLNSTRRIEHIFAKGFSFSRCFCDMTLAIAHHSHTSYTSFYYPWCTLLKYLYLLYLCIFFCYVNVQYISLRTSFLSHDTTTKFPVQVSTWHMHTLSLRDFHQLLTAKPGFFTASHTFVSATF